MYSPGTGAHLSDGRPASPFLIYQRTEYIIRQNKTGTTVPEHVFKTRRAGGITPLILNQDIRCRWVVSAVRTGSLYKAY